MQVIKKSGEDMANVSGYGVRQEQADFSLRSGLGQGSWETFSFFDTGLHFLANRQKRLNTSHKGNVGSCIYQSHFLHLLHTIIRSSKELETFGFHHQVGSKPQFSEYLLIFNYAHCACAKYKNRFQCYSYGEIFKVLYLRASGSQKLHIGVILCRI